MRHFTWVGLVSIATLSIAQQAPVRTGNQKPAASRFELSAPLPGLPAVVLDVVGNGAGVAQQRARAANLQARILWIDGTANLDRVGTADKVSGLVKQVAAVGFNTIVFDVKPIVGYTLYPSKLTDKITRWKDQVLPIQFDPLEAMVRECKKNKISLLVSMNAFSEGHKLAKQAIDQNRTEFGGKPGPGYEMPDMQTVLYAPKLELKVPFTSETYPISERTDVFPTKETELAVFGKIDKTRKAPPDAVGVMVDANGAAISMKKASEWDFVGIPENGSLLVGIGKGAQFLQKNVRFGFGVHYRSVTQFVKISDQPNEQIPLMMNPHHPAVQDRALEFIKEVLTKYDVDGVMFDDRLRYGGMNADFSDVTRAEFEKLVGRKLHWPDDVFEFTYGPDLTRGIKPGRWFDAWMTWRAETMRNWVVRAKETVKATRPKALFGVYAGSWFGEYNKYGSNYGSQSFNAGFSFLTDGYRKTGFASELDLLISGCYYRQATISEAMEKERPAGRTVEAAGQLTNRAIRDQAWTYAGIMLMDYYGNKRALKNALQAACGSTQGVMVFDLSHRINDVWEVFASAFKEPKKAPHQTSILSEVRKRRSELDKMGHKDPPVIIREGANGTGF